MSVDANDLFGSAGVAAKFPKVGHKYKGTVVSFDTRQQTDMESGDLKTWDDGSPMIEVLIVLDTDARDSFEYEDGAWKPVKIEDDDGQRTLYAKGGVFTAVKTALKEAKAKLAEGGTLEIEYTGDGTASKKGYNKPKQYKATYTAPEKEDPFAV